jgi:hypothetical protein
MKLLALTVLVIALILGAAQAVVACHNHQVCRTVQQGYDANGNPVYVTQCEWVCD